MNEDLVINCTRALMLPVVRFCLRRGVSVQQLIELIKELVVGVAAEELSRMGEKANTSRLSARTGMHRRDVARLFTEDERRPLPSTISARVVAQWESDARFLGTNGRPRVLDLKGGRASFSRLVQLVGTDLNVGTVLFELERSGAVQRTSQGVKLRRAHALARDGLLEGVKILASDWEDSVRTVERNTSEKDIQPDLHGRTEFDNIPVEREGEIRQWILEEGGKFHQKVRRYLARFDRDYQPASKSGESVGDKQRLRVALGTYSRIESSEN